MPSLSKLVDICGQSAVEIRLTPNDATVAKKKIVPASSTLEVTGVFSRPSGLKRAPREGCFLLRTPVAGCTNAATDAVGDVHCDRSQHDRDYSREEDSSAVHSGLPGPAVNGSYLLEIA